MRARLLPVLLPLLALSGLTLSTLLLDSAATAAAVAPVTIMVTTAEDNSTGTCPDAHLCTLRAAIAAANDDVTGAPITIAFSPASFPAATPATITITTAALPTINRDGVTIDASPVGVRVSAYGQSLSGTSNGLVLAGAGDTVRGLSIDGFPASCVLVQGANATVGGDAAGREGNRLGACSSGVAVTAAAAVVSGNAIGFAPGDNTASTVQTGILVTAGAAGAVIGDPGTCGTACANVIGNAPTAIRIGTGAGVAFTGVTISRNTIGHDPAGAPAPVGIGVNLQQPSSGTTVQFNGIYSANTGILVQPDVDGVSVAGNRFQQNTFGTVTGLAIDLNGDGATNPNGSSGHGGANGLLDHPVFTRAIQSLITGTVNANCSGCAIQLYVANHSPGSPNDYGTIPVPGGTTQAGTGGQFSFATPAVSQGQWVTALVTDAAGNTSEFGPSTRVGTGVAQCGNITLTAGWNHVGFFGANPVTLDSIFPDIGPGAGNVSAIYHLEDGAGTFSAWFAENAPGRTLSSLEPGDAYWFFATGPVTLNTGFSLSVPVPVPVKAGWNDVVYIGAGGDVRDALSSVAGGYKGVFLWTNDGPDAHWGAYGDASTPTWARGFSALQTCGAYEVYATADGTIVPLQP